MKSPKRSKAAETTKPETHDKDGAPTVAGETVTTILLPRPTKSPPPQRQGRKKVVPTVPAAPIPNGTETRVPGWAKRAAARDTATEMPVPEAAPNVESVTGMPAPKKNRLSNPGRNATAALRGKSGSMRAVGTAWIETLREAGHSVSTVSSYTNDLALAFEFLGEDTPAAALTEKQIAAFNTSKSVVKKRNGKPRAQPTILKTRRVLRLALTWAEQNGLIKKAPYSAA
jgi:hypothetical protein